MLADYDSSGWNWLDYLNALFAAEEQHVDMYARTMRSRAADHIAMINSLHSTDPAHEDTVGLYARSNGVPVF